MTDTTLLDSDAFTDDCRVLSQRQVEAKYGNNGTGRGLLRSYYQQVRRTAGLPQDDTAQEAVQEWTQTLQETPLPSTIDLSQVATTAPESEETAETNLPAELVKSFFSTDVDLSHLFTAQEVEDCDAEDAPPVMNRHVAEHLLSQALTHGKNLLRVLNTIRTTRAYEFLGCSSWDAFYKKYAEQLPFDKATFHRQINYQEQKQELASAELPTRELKANHAELIARIAEPEQRVAVWQKTIEIANADEPDGRHHAGTVFSRHVEAAIAEVVGEPQHPTPAAKDYLLPENRAKALNDAKTLPPVSTEPRETQTEQEPIRLGYVRMTRYTGQDGDFLWIVGDDGNDLYEIPMRVRDVKEMLK